MGERGIVNDDDVGPGAETTGRRPTMGDIAAHLGVSRQLVSAVLRNAPGASPQNRERVRQAARELGYSPHMAAQMLRRARTRQIGVVFTLGHPFDLDMVDCLYAGAQARGYGIVLSAATESHSENQAAHELFGLRTDGIILLGPNLPDRELREFRRGDPMVMFGRRTRIPGIDSVRSDDAAGVRNLVDYLVTVGHHDILHIDGADLPGGRERRTAYARAMRRHGLERHVRILGGDYTEESGAAAAGSLLADNALPTAIVAGNDRCAVGAMEVLLRLGIRVPTDISIAGFDDSRLSRMSYRKLTTIHQDAIRLSAAILDCLVERIEGGRSEDKEVVVPTTLIVRDSSGPPAQ